MDLYWFIPAFAKRRVGSECGTTEDEGTGGVISINIILYSAWKWSTESVSMLLIIFNELITDPLSRPRAGRLTHRAPGRYGSLVVAGRVEIAQLGSAVECSRSACKLEVEPAIPQPLHTPHQTVAVSLRSWLCSQCHPPESIAPQNVVSRHCTIDLGLRLQG